RIVYRTLDSEALSRLVDTGIIGLTLLLGMIASIFVVAKRAVGSPSLERASVGLAVAAAAMAYGVLEVLFDTTSFPPPPYRPLSRAGFLAAMGPEPGPRSSPRADDHGLPARHVVRTHRPPGRLEQPTHGAAH